MYSLALPLLVALQFFGRAAVRTPRDLDALCLSTYVLAAIIAGATLLAAAVASQMVDWEPGASPKDGRKRRVIFWGLLPLVLAGFASYNLMVQAPKVASNLQAKFLQCWAYGAVELLVLYVLLGFALSKILPRTKLGSWFPSRR